MIIPSLMRPRERALPSMEEMLEEMRAILEKWIKDTGDKGQLPEEPKAVTPRDWQRIQEDKTWPYEV